ncbi:MAG: hydroxymethylglutaryl-CoA reductase [Candidatus Nanopelagicales bacterium]|jgi:hydroxymethylglutaryl-CoA reductase (NADPH)|nr:hydroxymethylglutaryl-CoA reductase [Candidatus Nanopelagicales bacterium]
MPADIPTPAPSRGRSVPRDPHDDYREEAVARRRAFVAEGTGVALRHVGHTSIDPAEVAGNVENFLGVAQVPIGLAGPLRIDGEHVQGDVYVPLATTEGTLVASYNRGMRLLSEAGGVRTTIADDRMQRAPVFVLDDARASRALGEWISAHLPEIAAAAEATTRVGRLLEVEQYAVGPMRYLRFDYSTGDAAGQNMVGRATLAACEWISAHHPDHPRFLLSGGIDTDKKHSHMNVLRTRGKRVIAEATLPSALLEERMRVTPAQLFRARQVSMAGGMLAGTANNGAHAANGLAALFIATGQDVANVAESHAAIVYSQLLDSGDYYWSITLPALIVASVGGGTGLPTQRECLAMLGCDGPGTSQRLAEICAAVVLAGEVSLSSAVLAGDWVSSHERLGRNRR